MALREAASADPAARAAEERALAWLVRHARVKRAKGWELYNIWALGYGLQALSQALRTRAPGASAEEVRAAAEELRTLLDRYQTPDGGFGYYDFAVEAARPSWGTAFTTATCLVALREAESAGVEPTRATVEKAVRFLWRARTPDGDFVYSASHRYNPRGLINRAPGASMRNQACHLALRLSGEKIDDAVLRDGLDDLLVRHHRFAVAALRRPIPHESHYAVSGYFYLYGHYYAGLLLAHLPDPERRAHATRIVAAVLKARQPDGSFWDYPLYGYHKAYGTGYAVATLARCVRAGAE
jgi:hypothetical protein